MMISSLEKQSVAEAAAATIREAILRGDFEPGERLKENDLCKKLQISRTPLREAFRLLQMQNLVEYTTYSGVCVIQLTKRYVVEMWQIKSIIEPEVSALAAIKRQEKNIDELEAALHLLNDGESESHVEFVKKDNQFHIALARATDNLELCKLVTNLYENTLLPRSRSVMGTRRATNAYKEHDRIVQAIKDGDADKARQYTYEHMDTSKMAILSMLEKD